MARRTKIHVGIEIGTSKTCVAVGEVRPDAAVKILGIGHVRSAGVRKGEICDFGLASTCLKDAIEQAEDASNVQIGSVFLAITGAHIQGINNRGTVRLPEHQKYVTPESLDEVRSLARQAHIPDGNVYLHPIIRNFRLDGQEHALPPRGLHGVTLEADFHIVHGIASRIQNSIKIVREHPLDVDDVVFAPIATAQLALESEQRRSGALVIDIGGGTTDYVLYLNGVIAASGCIPVGGDHVTNDIHLVTGIRYSECETLKITEGDASADPARSVGIAKLQDKNGFSSVSVKRNILNDVIRQRLLETLHLVRQRLPAEAAGALGAGVFLTGGTSQMRGFSELAHEVFLCDVYRPESPDISGNTANFRDPRFATAIGLIRYAQILETENTRKTGFLGRILGTFWPRLS